MAVEVRQTAEDVNDRAIAGQGTHLAWHRWQFTYADPNNGYADAFYPVSGGQARLVAAPTGYRGLIERARGEQNRQARINLYRECERLLQSEAAYIPIAYPTTFYLIRPWVVDFPATSDDLLIAPSRVFTRLTSLVAVKGRPAT